MANPNQLKLLMTPTHLFMFLLLTQQFLYIHSYIVLPNNDDQVLHSNRYSVVRKRESIVIILIEIKMNEFLTLSFMFENYRSMLDMRLVVMHS